MPINRRMDKEDAEHACAEYYQPLKRNHAICSHMDELSEVSQKEKEKYHTSSLYVESKKKWAHKQK